MSGRKNPAGLPGDYQSSCECCAISFIKMFLKKLGNGKIDANSGVSLLVSCVWIGAPVLWDGNKPGQGGEGCNYSALDKP